MLSFEDWAARADDVDVGGLRVAAHDEGHGPVATFLHGYPSSSLDATPLLGRLGRVRLVTLDLPGFGASEKPVDHPWSIHSATDAVEAVWAHYGVTETVLVAHDYSVSVAQELLARQADAAAAGGHRHATITGVVWSNGGLYPDLHRQTLGQRMLRDPEHGAEVAAAMDEEALANAVRGTWGTRRPPNDAELHGMWVALAQDGGSRQAHRLLHYIDDRLEHQDRWRTALESRAVPMRFVWGELDPVSGGHVADRLAERMPDVPLQRLLDVGHWPPLEATDEVAAATVELIG